MAREYKPRSNAVFAALANPERRRILDLLRGEGRPAGELVDAFPNLPQPAVSRHLRILREAGLVKAFPRAQQRVYYIQPTALREVDSWISHYRQFWSGRLEKLADQLDREG
jgi:DNA-binding transcriptional ArsR family regulator